MRRSTDIEKEIGEEVLTPTIVESRTLAAVRGLQLPPAVQVNVGGQHVNVLDTGAASRKCSKAASSSTRSKLAASHERAICASRPVNAAPHRGDPGRTFT